MKQNILQEVDREGHLFLFHMELDIISLYKGWRDVWKVKYKLLGVINFNLVNPLSNRAEVNTTFKVRMAIQYFHKPLSQF